MIFRTILFDVCMYTSMSTTNYCYVCYFSFILCRIQYCLLCLYCVATIYLIDNVIRMIHNNVIVIIIIIFLKCRLFKKNYTLQVCFGRFAVLSRVWQKEFENLLFIYLFYII